MHPEPTPPEPTPPRTGASTPARVAGLLVGLEAIGVAALAGAMMPALIAGDTTDLGTALALILMTVVAAVALFAFAFAILRGHGWGRSGAIVAQLLILAVALGAVGGIYAHPLIALALAVPAVATLILLFAAARAAGRAGGPPPVDP